LLQPLSPVLSPEPCLMPVIFIPSGFPSSSLGSPIQNILVSFRFLPTHTLSRAAEPRCISSEADENLGIAVFASRRALNIHTNHHTMSRTTLESQPKLSNVKLTA
jgi:hypothetical protein